MTTFTAWAQDVGIRAVKTAAQTAVAALGVNASGLLAINWAAVGSLAGLAALTCVLQNLASLNLGSAPVPVPVLPYNKGGWLPAMAPVAPVVAPPAAP